MTNLKTKTETLKNRWKSPSIRDTESEGHASWIELFFDLVFVVVVAELSHYLSEHLTIVGFLQFAMLFVPCWWGWVLFTFYSDRYETDDVIHRLLILSAMLAVIFLAANIHNAFSNGAIGFVLAYVTLRSIVLALYTRVARHQNVAVANLKLYLSSYIPSTCLWLISIATPANIRYIFWGVAIFIELLMPILGSQLLANTPVHRSHLPERFGLLTLIVIGESIVSVATATTQTNWNLVPTIAAIGAFIIAACLWWLYFNFLETAVIIRGIGSVHVYNYGHLPILMGLSLVAVGAEHIIEEASHQFLSVGTSWTLCGGVTLYMLSIGVIWVIDCRRRLTWLLVGTIAIALTLAIIGKTLPPLLVEGLLMAMLVAKVIIEILRSKPEIEAGEENIIKIDV